MEGRLILKALWKPQLYAGVELIPLVFIFFISGEIVMTAASIYLKLAGALFGLTLYVVLRKINKNEPYQFSILIRYISYQKFYLNIAKHGSGINKIHNKYVG